MRNKILSLLVLLLTAATGAWAQSLHSFYDLRNEIESGGNKILQYDYYKYESGPTIEITTTGVIDGNGAIIDMEGATISPVFYIYADNVTIKNLSIINYTGTGDAIQFTGTGGSMVNVVYAVAVSPGTSANTWTLSMPASDVLLTPQYATVAKWAVERAGTPEEKTLLPAAAEGVIAGTDAPLIAEGTGIVAFAGTSTEDKQGTVMYAVTPATATEAPVIGSSDWKDAVPTAKDIADGGAEVKVWYYIQGADAPDGEDATLDNTFNNSDVCTQPIEVSVLTNKFTLTLDPAPVEKVTVTIGGTPVTDATQLQAGKIPNVKMGKTVKLAPNTGYKLRKVEVKKTIPKPAATVTTRPRAETILMGSSDSDALITTGSVEGGTMKYALTKTETQPTDADFSFTTPPTVGDMKTCLSTTTITPANVCYVWYKVFGDSDHSDSDAAYVTVTVSASYD